jgi:putative transposase
VRMCVWAGVSRAGFYEWRGRPTSATASRRFWLAVKVAKVFKRSKGVYGYRKVHAELGRRGIEVGPELVRELMGVLGLVSCHPRRWRITTLPGAESGPVDLLRRDFTARAPGQRFVGDITYISTWEGRLYLSTVIDLCTHEVVGWATADHMRTSLVCDSISMVHRHRDVAEGAIFHSDRGCQYTSSELADHLASLNMIGSMGRTGVCWDNALAESFFASLKKECVYQTVFSTHKKAAEAVADYIEMFYNRERIHANLGYRTPLEVFESYQAPEAV